VFKVVQHKPIVQTGDDNYVPTSMSMAWSANKLEQVHALFAGLVSGMELRQCYKRYLTHSAVDAKC